MLHLVKPAKDDGLEIPLSVTAVPLDDDRLRLAMLRRCRETTATLRHAEPHRAEDLP